MAMIRPGQVLHGLLEERREVRDVDRRNEPNPCQRRPTNRRSLLAVVVKAYFSRPSRAA